VRDVGLCFSARRDTCGGACKALEARREGKKTQRGREKDAAMARGSCCRDGDLCRNRFFLLRLETKEKKEKEKKEKKEAPWKLLLRLASLLLAIAIAIAIAIARASSV
jgi:hypothetical protein